MFTNGGRKQLLDSTDAAWVALHTGYPGHTGASETSGGSYARGAITFSTATNSDKTQSGTVAISVSATAVIRWASLNNASVSGACRWVCPAGGSGKEYECSPTGNVITVPSHGYSDNDAVTFYMTAPGGITAGTIYYVRDKTTDTFKVTATAGGTAIDITSRPSAGDALVSRIVPNSGSARTITISALTLGLGN